MWLIHLTSELEYVALIFALIMQMINRNTGIISTYAGNGMTGTGTDNIRANATQFNSPSCVVYEPNKDEVYICDSFNNRIRKVNASNIITTVTGGGFGVGFGGDGGIATVALLNNPKSIAFSSNSTIMFVSDTSNLVIRAVNMTSTIISTIAGTPSASGSEGDGGNAKNAKLGASISQMIVEESFLFICDTSNSKIRRINMSTNVIETVLGTGSTKYAGDGNFALSAALSAPYALAMDLKRNLLFISDPQNNRVRLINSSSNIISTFAGTGQTDMTGDGGLATLASFKNPTGLAFDSTRDLLYIADSDCNVVRAVAMATQVITTLVGQNGDGGYNGEGKFANQSLLKSPSGLFYDAQSDSLFIADSSNNRIRQVNLTIQRVTTYAGGATVGFFGDGGQRQLANLRMPTGITIDSKKRTLYFTDRGNHRIRKIDMQSNIISTVIGNGQAISTGDGFATVLASTNDPFGIDIDEAKQLLFFSEQASNVVRVIDLSTNFVTRIAGTRTEAFDGDGDFSVYASLKKPKFLMVSANGVYIVDADNNRIRLVTNLTCNIGSGGSYPNCSYCAAGMYMSDFGALSCLPCNAGMYSTTLGSITKQLCFPCSAGTFSVAGSSICTLSCWFIC